jgi:two-component system response regulator AtoC
MYGFQEYRPADALIGDSPPIRRTIDQIHRAAVTEDPVFITGECGTGKELAARLVHDLSFRRARPFIKVSCPTVPSQNFDSELFGHEAGAFPGALEERIGKCQMADKGTLFLDEIGDLSPALQPKLLHALEDFRAARSGAMDESIVDIRLVASSSRNLEVEIGKTGFRSDLYYRINVLRISMPPLRDRPSDVPILLNHFIRVYGARLGSYPPQLSSRLAKVLQGYHWPGNIRELETIAKRYVVMGGEEQVISMLQNSEEARMGVDVAIDMTIPLRVQTKRAIQQFEMRAIMSVLQAQQWNRRKTAHSLGISYSTLLSKIKEGRLPTGRASKTTLLKHPLQETGEEGFNRKELEPLS